MADAKITDLTAAGVLSGTEVVPAVQGGTDVKATTAAFGVLPRVLNTQVGTTYTLVLSDVGVLLRLNNAAAITLTIPTNASVAFPVGSQIDLAQAGAGQVTVSPAGGVTMNSSGAKTKLTGQYSVASLIKVATDTWLLAGDIST